MYRWYFGSSPSIVQKHVLRVTVTLADINDSPSITRVILGLLEYDLDVHLTSDEDEDLEGFNMGDTKSGSPQNLIRRYTDETMRVIK